MLAILFIEMKWHKENRTPKGAVQRQKYYKPIKIEDGVNLSGDGIFLKKCSYYQHRDSVFSESGTKQIWKDSSSFYNIEKIDIPCISIYQEQENAYRIKWFDDGKGMPRRRGGNEDLYKKGAKLAGKPNTLNETAFILEEGKAGVLKYNYRHSSYDGQWYKCYYVYMVNDRVLKQDIFMRTYDYEYHQLADLF